MWRTDGVPLWSDPLPRIAQEARLPAGDPPALDPDAPGDAGTRATLVAELDADAGDPVAWALPLHRTEDGTGWATTAWTTRRGRVVLSPGTSPAGLRLPLDSIAWTPPPGRPEPSRFRPLAPLPAPGGEPAPAAVTPVEDAPTTALCIQERDGHVHVFLPPLENAADAVALLGAVDAAVTATGVPVVLEGYAPPGDPRTRTLTVTPDPGVIEVNAHPAGSWSRSPRPCTAARTRSGWAPRRSPSTAPTPAPAAATTSRSAARPRPTRRCCAAPTCSSRC